MELRLELMAVVRLDGMNTERELSSDTVDKITSIFLTGPVVNVQYSCSRSVIDGSVLKPSYFLFGEDIGKVQELYIHLNPVARYLLFIPFKRLQGTLSLIFQQAVQAIPFQYAIHSFRRNADTMITLHVPSDATWSQVIGCAKMEGQFFDVLRNTEVRILRAGLGIDQGLLSPAFIGSLPSVKDFSGNTKMPAGLGNVADLLTVCHDAKLAPDV